jgi:hypothetical protein
MAKRGASQSSRPKARQSRSSVRAPKPPKTSAALAKLSDASLLDLRFKDLPISLDRSPVADEVLQLHDELAEAGLRLQPHAWLSDEWFTPQGVPGIAVPFYLAHPRLTRLERKMMLEAEGDTHAACMRILRHEAGHCVQYAWNLHRRKRWQRLFGRSSAPYPESFSPKPYSRSFVQHLDSYYAQAHPDEDFAETFAVWLSPHVNWRRRYAHWPALEKLEYVDELMQQLAGVAPAVRTRRRPDPITRNTKTLRAHYDERRAAVAIDEPDMYTRDLKRLFAAPGPSSTSRTARGRSAAAFLRANRRQLVRTVARHTGQYQYSIDTVAREVIDRCADLALRLPEDRSDEQLRIEAATLLTVLAMNEVHNDGLRLTI